jgi:hypothetical protein
MEEHSKKFVEQIFKNAKGTLSEVLKESYGDSNALVHYKEMEAYLDSLNFEELREFFRKFINAVHQSGYHISEERLEEFMGFSEGE